MYSEISGQPPTHEQAPPVLRDNEQELIDYWRAYNQANPAHRDETMHHKPLTHDEYLRDAATNFDIAVEEEDLYGVEDFRTLEAYERARQAFGGVIWTADHSLETDSFSGVIYTDMLKYAECLSKLASSHNLSPYKNPESRGFDRNQQLFKASLSAFDQALSVVGISAPEEVWHEIIALKVDAYARHAKYLAESGKKDESELAFTEAVKHLAQVREYAESDEVQSKVARQTRNLQDSSQGFRREEPDLADDLVHALVRR